MVTMAQKHMFISNQNPFLDNTVAVHPSGHFLTRLGTHSLHPGGISAKSAKSAITAKAAKSAMSAMSIFKNLSSLKPEFAR